MDIERIGDQVGEDLFKGNWSLTIFEFMFVKDHLRYWMMLSEKNCMSNFVGKDVEVFEFIGKRVMNCASNAICNYYWWKGLPTKLVVVWDKNLTSGMFVRDDHF